MRLKLFLIVTEKDLLQTTKLGLDGPNKSEFVQPASPLQGEGRLVLHPRDHRRQPSLRNHRHGARRGGGGCRASRFHHHGAFSLHVRSWDRGVRRGDTVTSG